MPVHHIDVTRKKSTPGGKTLGPHIDRVPVGKPPDKASTQKFAPPVTESVPDQRNESGLSRYTPVENGEQYIAPGTSEPRSGGPEERAMTAPAHERRHPNYPGIESGKAFASQGEKRSEPLNAEKFSGTRVLIQPAGGHEPMPPVKEVLTDMGYPPETTAHMDAALQGGHLRYPFRQEIDQKSLGLAMGENKKPEWSEPHVVVSEEQGENLPDRDKKN